ncbi:MAG: transposase [Ruminococcaceae bacterium]|nr:transposase [Oscillospiraceae bacterium]
MPRAKRVKSESGIYHIILRGINQQVIFEAEEDYEKFIETILKYKAVSGYKVFAYCLMSNHIHLIIKAEKEEIDQIMKRIAGSYVYWYNWKYYRKGHLFQDRFKSEPIEDEKYLLTAIRYIHQNPLKAEIVNRIDEYKYSSYNEYVRDGIELIDKEFIYGMINKEGFIVYNNEKNDDKCLDSEDFVFRMSDEDAKKIIKKIVGCENTTELQLFNQKDRDKFIKKLKCKGLSIRQISRLTGVSKGIVEKI